MGLLVNGEWHDQWYNTKTSAGEFIREDAQYRHWITVDGTSGPSGEGGFKAESDRYHLYVSLACPWAHRTLIFRKLKQLENIISVSIVNPDMLDQGWSFAESFEGDSTHAKIGDDLFQSGFLHQIYTKDKADYSGRVTVPVLWDKKLKRIVNNESSEIIRIFNSAFNHLTGNSDDYYPSAQRQRIDQINQTIYTQINNGVYRAGFATTPTAYERAVGSLFDELNKIDEHLASHRYLLGDQLTEADWRLFTTLIRFDAVYVGHFKCNLKRIADYPNLSGYVRELYQFPGVKSTVNMEHIKRHYYYSHDMINPTRIVPVGPALDFDSDHGRQNPL